jgi:hypothetical protein
VQRLLGAYDLPLNGMVALLEIPLLGHRRQGLRNGTLACLLPAVFLVGEQASLAAAGAESGGVHAGGLHYHCELAGSVSALRFLLRGRDHLPLQPPGLPSLVEGDYEDAQFPGDFRHALAVGRAHPTSDTSLDGTAVRTH